MQLNIKKSFLYLLPLVMAALLLRYTYRDVSWQELKIQLQQLRAGWIIWAIGIELVGHLVKAYRWTLLLKPVGFQIGILRSLQALLAGYLSTLLIPRIGELVRCSLLNRTTGVPLGVSLGASILERLLGGIGFLIIGFLALLVSFPAIAATFQTVPMPAIDAISLVGVVVGLILVFLVSGYVLYTKHASNLLRRIQPFINNLKKGFTSIRLSSIKKRIAFLTLLEWGIYYWRDYISIFALQGAAEPLSWTVGLAILTMSTISFALPVQGGLGAYHLLVSSVLMAYGVPAGNALLYAGVMHSAHFVGVIMLGGVITLFMSLFKPK